MIRWITSLITGSERPNHLEARVQAASRNVSRAQRELALTIQKDRDNVRAAFENILTAEPAKNDES